MPPSPLRPSTLLDPQTVLSRSDGWLAAWVGPELVMMHGASGRYLSLTETGGRIWDLIEQPLRFDTLCTRLAGEYEATPEQLRSDVLRFVEQLRLQEAIHVGKHVGTEFRIDAQPPIA